MNKIHPVSSLVAGLIEPDPESREALIAEVTETGGEYRREWGGWKGFLVRFAHHEPFYVLLSPLAFGLLLFVVIQGVLS